MTAVRDHPRGALRPHVPHHVADGPVDEASTSEEPADHEHAIDPGTLDPIPHRTVSDRRQA
jgi:hypothetical protein